MNCLLAITSLIHSSRSFSCCCHLSPLHHPITWAYHAPHLSWRAHCSHPCPDSRPWRLHLPTSGYKDVSPGLYILLDSTINLFVINIYISYSGWKVPGVHGTEWLLHQEGPGAWICARSNVLAWTSKLLIIALWMTVELEGMLEDR